jgi:hypothetical protein
VHQEEDRYEVDVMDMHFHLYLYRSIMIKQPIAFEMLSSRLKKLLNNEWAISAGGCQLHDLRLTDKHSLCHRCSPRTSTGSGLHPSQRTCSTPSHTRSYGPVRPSPPASFDAPGSLLVKFNVEAAPPYFFGAVSAGKLGKHPMPVNVWSTRLTMVFAAPSTPKRM